MKYLYQIYLLLATGMLAVVLPQQNAMGQVINTDGIGDTTLSDLRLSGVTLTPAFSPDNGYYTT